MRFYEFATINLKSPSPYKDREVPSWSVPEPMKRRGLRRELTAQIARAANVPEVTRRDVEVAVKNFEIQQKRANLAYRDAVRDQQRRVQRARRRGTAGRAPLQDAFYACS